MSKVEKAAKFMETIATDNSHGYDQLHRWGNPDYDCSSLVISAYEQAGVKVRTAGATYTGNMYNVFIKCGFKDVTSSVNRQTGGGLKRGDVLLNKTHHTAMYIGSGRLAEAAINEQGGIYGGRPGDQTGQEIRTRSYYSYPWDCVLRYPESEVQPEKVSYITYYTKADLNYRLGPGVGYALKGTFAKGTKVTAIKGAEQSVSGGVWVKLKSGYWCCKSYLTTSKPNTKSVAEIAKEVIAGKWGNGTERVRKLTAAGYNYTEVQREVNRQLKANR